MRLAKCRIARCHKSHRVGERLGGTNCRHYEQDQLAEGLAAKLRADRRLGQIRPADLLSLLVNFAAAIRPADNRAALSHRREDRVAIRVINLLL